MMKSASFAKYSPGQILTRLAVGGGELHMRVRYAPTAKSQLVLERISDVGIEHAVFEEPFWLKLVRIRVGHWVAGHRPALIR